MAWIALSLAGLFEIVWAFFMKQSEGFAKITPTIVTFVTMIASVVLLLFSMKTLPLGTAYALWTGIGAIGAFIVGIIFLGEQVSVLRVAAALLIVLGLLLMKLSARI